MTTDVARIDNYPALAGMMNSLYVEAPPGGEGMAPEQRDRFVMDVMEQILSAETFEDIFAAQDQGMVSGKDFTGRPFLLRGDDIQVLPSTIQGPGGFTHFAICKVTEIATGDVVTINCGGKTFMATLYALREGGYFTAEKGCPPDGRPLMLTGNETQSGTEFLRLQPFAIAVPERAGKKK